MIQHTDEEAAVVAKKLRKSPEEVKADLHAKIKAIDVKRDMKHKKALGMIYAQLQTLAAFRGNDASLLAAAQTVLGCQNSITADPQ
jgi:hypothetical protein